MTLRLRCPSCRAAFIITADPKGQQVSCPRCGVLHPDRPAHPETSAAGARGGFRPRERTADAEDRVSKITPATGRLRGDREPIEGIEPTGELAGDAESVFVPSGEARHHRRRKIWLAALATLTAAVLLVTALMVARPLVRPRQLDPVERLAERYLQSLVDGDEAAASAFGLIEQPPAIRSFLEPRRQAALDQVIQGSFAPLGKLHQRIAAEYTYDPSAGRFLPKNPLGPAAQTLDALHQAKEEAEASGLFEKMASGDPDDLFLAAESYGKVFAKLAEGALAPRRILPTYRMLLDQAQPPLPRAARDLALLVAEDPELWQALLRRPFHTLKADGPFVHETAEVEAVVTDRLASLGDPPSTLRLTLVRFQLEGIDTGWKVIAARRVGAEPADLDDPDSAKSAPNRLSPSFRQEADLGSQGADGSFAPSIRRYNQQ